MKNWNFQLTMTKEEEEWYGRGWREREGHKCHV